MLTLNPSSKLIVIAFNRIPINHCSELQACLISLDNNSIVNFGKAESGQEWNDSITIYCVWNSVFPMAFIAIIEIFMQCFCWAWYHGSTGTGFVTIVRDLEWLLLCAIHDRKAPKQRFFTVWQHQSKCCFPQSHMLSHIICCDSQDCPVTTATSSKQDCYSGCILCRTIYTEGQGDI